MRLFPRRNDSTPGRRAAWLTAGFDRPFRVTFLETAPLTVTIVATASFQDTVMTSRLSHLEQTAESHGLLGVVLNRLATAQHTGTTWGQITSLLEPAIPVWLLVQTAGANDIRVWVPHRTVTALHLAASNGVISCMAAAMQIENPWPIPGDLLGALVALQLTAQTVIQAHASTLATAHSNILTTNLASITALTPAWTRMSLTTASGAFIHDFAPSRMSHIAHAAVSMGRMTSVIRPPCLMFAPPEEGDIPPSLPVAPGWVFASVTLQQHLLRMADAHFPLTALAWGVSTVAIPATVILDLQVQGTGQVILNVANFYTFGGIVAAVTLQAAGAMGRVVMQADPGQSEKPLTCSGWLAAVPFGVLSVDPTPRTPPLFLSQGGSVVGGVSTTAMRVDGINTIVPRSS